MQSSLMPDEPQIAKPKASKRKKAKPFTVWYKGGWRRHTWNPWNNYAKLEIAQRALNRFRLKYGFWEWKLCGKGGEHDQISEVDSSGGPTEKS